MRRDDVRCLEDSVIEASPSRFVIDQPNETKPKLTPSDIKPRLQTSRRRGKKMQEWGTKIRTFFAGNRKQFEVHIYIKMGYRGRDVNRNVHEIKRERISKTKRRVPKHRSRSSSKTNKSKTYDTKQNRSTAKYNIGEEILYQL